MAHNDTPWIGLQGTNTLYLQSGQFNATVKTSLQIESAIEIPVGISWDGIDTPISGRNIGDTIRKLYITSGQFTTTIKESEDVTGSSVGLQGVSIDLVNVPWADQGAGAGFVEDPDLELSAYRGAYGCGDRSDRRGK